MSLTALDFHIPRGTRVRLGPSPTPTKRQRDAEELERRKAASWIQTYTGKKFHPFAPVVDDIDVEDIAHSLSLQCRWNGHVKQLKDFYSVAQHAVLVSYYVPTMAGGLLVAPWALHHDDAEAYISDVPSPVKAFCPELKVAEHNLELAIRKRFSIPHSPAVEDAVKSVDTWMMFQEGKHLLKHPELLDDWANEPGRRLPDMSHLPDKLRKGELTPWPSEVAKSRFLSRFHTLSRLNRGK